ncbi:MAG: nucleotidyltransferase family protein [Elusimicrobia bacterium]|nr:nucleotidyltransferase family protein [Elusimicrobiota bacterium]
MDFDLVLKNLLEGFDRLKIRYAALGAFGMAVLGVQRATGDLDFLVRKDDLASLDLLMASLRYKTLFRNENVTQYDGENIVLGHVDFLHAFRPLALKILDRSLSKPVFNGLRQLRVVQPEDLIAFKVQSLANNPHRRHRELADIELMLSILGKELDWARLKDAFDLFGEGETLKALQERFLP